MELESRDLRLLNMQTTTQRGPGLIPNFSLSLWPRQIIIKQNSPPPSFPHLLFSAVGFFMQIIICPSIASFLPLFSTVPMAYGSHFLSFVLTYRDIVLCLMESGTKRRKTLDSAAGIQTRCTTVGTNLWWKNSAHFFNAQCSCSL